MNKSTEAIDSGKISSTSFGDPSDERPAQDAAGSVGCFNPYEKPPYSDKSEDSCDVADCSGVASKSGNENLATVLEKVLMLLMKLIKMFGLDSKNQRTEFQCASSAPAMEGGYRSRGEGNRARGESDRCRHVGRVERQVGIVFTKHRWLD